ncbi:hypothetical protein BJ741DRAFT_713632 [Chytriomyces cf. hyalinus JEL632]|nr:hypothetical protein BJ741DRAFT_713632 [Chytriomyces cf. hyalinus JEL632]
MLLTLCVLSKARSPYPFAAAKSARRAQFLSQTTPNAPFDCAGLQMQTSKFDHSLVWRHEDCPLDEIWDALPFISELKYLEVAVPRETYHNDNLSRCLNLKEVAFTQLLRDDPVVGESIGPLSP